MTPLSLAYVATAIICLVVGVQTLVTALLVEERRTQLLFALSAFAVAADAIFELRLYSSATAEEFLAIMPWTALCIATAMVSLTWYITIHFREVRGALLWLITVLAPLAALLDYSVGIAFEGPVVLQQVSLPWGETVALASGAASPLRLVGDVALLTFLLILLDATVRLTRQGAPRQARILGASVVLYALALLTIIPVDLGWFQVPSPHTFAFLGILGAMGWEVNTALLRASRLSLQIMANERRWREVVERAPFLVVEISPSGALTAVNPTYEKVTGRSAHQVLGKDFLELLPEAVRREGEIRFAEAMDGEVLPAEWEGPLQTESGDTRHVVWRSVVLRDEEGQVEGLLTLGADVTEKQQALEQRDRALRELEDAVKELEDLKTRLEEENLYLKDEIEQHQQFEGIVGESDALLYVLHKVRQVATSDATVLISGETGVGKELVARTIHQEGERSSGPFVTVNCAALSPNLVESELFGHEKGAFTGADRIHKGRFELAHGGTLFLDEVGELPLETQSKLLRVLQDGEIQRVGGERALHADVRLIAATNRPLREDVEAGRFREDLFYRLDVFPLTVPPLRDRREDIPLLVNHLVGKLCTEHGRAIHEIPADLLRRLSAYPWPGNIRELRNVLERAVITSPGQVLRLADPLEIKASPAQSVAVELQDADGRLPTLDELNRQYITYVLSQCKGQIAGHGGAAEVLGLHANTLRSRLKKLGINGHPDSWSN